MSTAATGVSVQSKITIGQALEATVQTAGKKPVDQSDAAAIQAAEVRASSDNVIAPGGVAASAQSAADYNAAIEFDENKIKLVDVLAVKPPVSNTHFFKRLTSCLDDGVLNVFEPDVRVRRGS